MSGPRFQPGNKMGGRRKERLIYEALMVALKRPVSKHDELKCYQKIVNNLVDLAVQGDMQAIKEVIDRTDGKAVTPIDLDVNDNRTIRELTDAELHAIAGGAGDTVETDGAGEPDRVH